MTKHSSIWVGWDPREEEAFIVARTSILRRLSASIPVRGLYLDELRRLGLYWRETEYRGNQLWDVISEAPMATQFSISRFLTPHLAGNEGWALFMDADMMARADLAELFALADPTKAVMVVQHNHRPTQTVKMDGQIQTQYARKNWSSLMLWNLGHPGTQRLTVKMVNSLPGRDLHRFCWLQDEEIGSLPVEWNFLVGHTTDDVEPKIVHHTDGAPCMPGYHDAPYADEWHRELMRALG